MKNTYAAPAATTRGDVVLSTLGPKSPGVADQFNPTQQASSGSALSFGL